MVYVGMDIHKRFSQVVVMDEGGQILRRRRLEHRGRKGMELFFSELPEGSPVALEPMGSWMWLADFLQGLSLDVRLVNPMKVRLIAESRTKTDKVDATVLAQLLRTDFLPEAYLAPPQVREARDLLRYRQALVAMASRIKCQIHALLDRLGIFHDFSDLFGKKGLQFLQGLKLGLIHRQALDGRLLLLASLRDLIKESEARINEVVKESAQAQRLMTIPGVGKIIAFLLLAEIGPIERFSRPQQLAAYGGLIPSVHQSGSHLRYGRLTRQGNRYIRWAMVEAAQVAARWDPSLRVCHQRLARRKGYGTATAALARKLLVAVYHVLRKQEEYHPRKGKIYRIKSASLGKPVAPMVNPS